MKKENILNIQAINSIISANKLRLTDSKHPISFRSRLANVSMDTFIRTHETAVKTALAKLNKINKAEYLTLTSQEKEALRREIASKINLNTKAEILNEEIKLHQFAAENIRQAFDSEFGKGKYIVVIIGRSLSSIGKLLGMKIGEENVKNIPLSNLTAINTKGDNQLEDWGEKFYNPDVYKLYLSSIGLSKENIENSDKQYIILDYAFSGKSIKNAYKILTSDFFWGNKKRNITAVSNQELLPENFQKERTNLAVCLQRGNFKFYSFVNRINSKRETDFTKLTDYNYFCFPQQIETHKLFGFGLLDSEYGTNGAKGYQNLEISKDVNSYPGQHRRIWNNAETQFRNDLFEDEYELDKAIKRNPSNSKLKNLKQELRKATSPIAYYVDLRQRIFQALSDNN